MTEYDGTTTSDTQHEKIYDNNEKGWHFRLDDDNEMGYTYILSIT